MKGILSPFRIGEKIAECLNWRYFPTFRSKNTLATAVATKISALVGNKVEFLVANSRNEDDGTRSDSQKCIRSFMYG